MLTLIFRYLRLDKLAGQQYRNSESDGIGLILSAKCHEIEVAIPVWVQRKVNATNHEIVWVLTDCR